MNQPDEQPTNEATAETAILEVSAPIPTLRQQVEEHLTQASQYGGDHCLMHLAIAAGIGLASTTLDDIDAAEADARIPALIDTLTRRP